MSVDCKNAAVTAATTHVIEFARSGVLGEGVGLAEAEGSSCR